MAENLRPIVGEWYQAVTGECFEVVAYDVADETIEIQYYDGAVEEIDMDTWLELPMGPAEPPEDWTGSMDVMREDFPVDLDAPGMHDGYDFLDELDNLA